MTPATLKATRIRLGLTQAQLAHLLDIGPRCVRRFEAPPDKVTSRSLPPRAERLIRAYEAGYRPEDWPQPTGESA